MARANSSVVPGLPDFDDIVASFRPRMTGLEANRPILTFFETDCLSNQLTEKGSILADLLGTETLRESTWTTLSA